MEPLQIHHLSDRALRVVFGSTISEQTNQMIRAFCLLLEEETGKGIVEWVPSYTAVTLYYDTLRLSPLELETRIHDLCERVENKDVQTHEIYEIPVCYDEEYGPDLEKVAAHNRLAVEDVIWTHTKTDYLIYMLGFIPGFPYLGGMNQKIATPRLSTPRTQVMAGSVGIANSQTGIYPLESPGGWNIIGRTPVKLFDQRKREPVLLSPGHYIRFNSISKKEFLDRLEHESGG